MSTETTLPGIQFYTANFIEQGPSRQGDTVYGPAMPFAWRRSSSQTPPTSLGFHPVF